MLTRKQVSARLGIGRTTLGRWRADGRIKARICSDRGEWLYWPPERRLVTGDRTHFGPLYGRRLRGVEVLSPADALARLMR